MVIRLRCSCGKTVQAADDQAGRKARCPACRALVRVPGDPEDSAGYAIEQVLECPGCKHEWPIGTVVCIDCGYHFEAGRKMRTKYNVPDRIIDFGFVWLGTYARYRVHRGKGGRPCLTVSQQLLFLPLGSVTYDLTRYSALLTDFTAGDRDTPDRYSLEMEGPGRKPELIADTANEEKFKELIDLLAEAGRLEIKRK
jgi:hypothetical protein